MGLEQYKKPEAVEFTIEEERFVVELPSRWNRAFVRSWQEKMAADMNDEGKLEVKKSVAASRLQEYQHTAFADNCFIESPLTPDELKDEYYPLLEILFDAATELANEKEAAADALVGKLSPISSGKPNGKDKSSSTKSLKQVEESPAMT